MGADHSLPPRVPQNVICLTNQNVSKICPCVPKIEEHKIRSDKIPDKQTTGRQLDCIYSWNFYWVEMRRMGCVISRGIEPDLGLSLECWVMAVGAGPGSRPAPLQLCSALSRLCPRGLGGPCLTHLCIPSPLPGTLSKSAND